MNLNLELAPLYRTLSKNRTFQIKTGLLKMELKIKPLDAALEATKDFLQAVIIPPLEQVGGLLADTVKLWRLKNQINILTKAESLLKERGIKTKQSL